MCLFQTDPCDLDPLRFYDPDPCESNKRWSGLRSQNKYFLKFDLKISFDDWKHRSELISADNVNLPSTKWTKCMICVIFHHGSDSDPATRQDSWITDLDWSGSQIWVKRIMWITNLVQDQSETNAPTES